MNSSLPPIKPAAEADKLLYVIFDEKDRYSLPEDSCFQEHHIHLQLNADVLGECAQSYADNQGECIHDYQHYGFVSGLYWIWKNVNYPFIGFSLTRTVIHPAADELDSFLSASRDVFLISKQHISCSLQENYRDFYYGYDFRILRSVLQKYAPVYYNFAKEKIVDSYFYINSGCVMKKEVLRKFCVWLFPLLEKCRCNIPERRSVFQNRYLEHLAYFLFIIYFQYHEEKLKIQYTDGLAALSVIPVETKASEDMPDADSLFALTERYLQKGEVELAMKTLQDAEETAEAKTLLKVFERYSRERRHYKTTCLESQKTLAELVQEEEVSDTPSLSRNKRKVLVIEWESVGHNESLLAFKTLGFECDTYKTSLEQKAKKEDFLMQFSQYLEQHDYDLVFSINYFSMASEACYVHDIPYISWTYDSPASLVPWKYLSYSTTYVFLFDSKEAEYYNHAGYSNVHYMPLAVNVSRLDGIVCSPADMDKYSASISFVGRLYESLLPEAESYLPDYQKAYLNALVDNQLGVYDYNLFSAVVSKNFMEWLSKPRFNQVLNAGEKKKTVSTDMPSPKSLQLQLCRAVTNRERLLLISILSNHWTFKLYSPSSHEVFKSTVQCGSIEYYQEMPKAFRCSKINLNATLRSIEAGIPLRCLDVMGCHGLLLTNYQRDLDEHFKDQKNLLIYHSIEEAYEKADYYLSHESDRQKIANAGYETVKQYYNYPDLLKRMLKTVHLDYLLR